MQCSKIISILEGKYPKEAALSWDNVGLLVGRDDKEVHRIYIALDADNRVIDNAVACKADLLITHHPLIFSPMKHINNQDFIGAKVLKLIQNDISYYAMHTNYDVFGMAGLSGEMLELKNPEVLEVTWEDGNSEGIGRIGNLPRTMTLKECCEWIKEVFHLPAVKVFGNINNSVSRAAVSPGAGEKMISAAISKEAEVLITGDISHHTGIDAVDNNLMIIDAGHYGLEHIFIEDVKKYMNAQIPEVVVDTEMIRQPFEII